MISRCSERILSYWLRRVTKREISSWTSSLAIGFISEDWNVKSPVSRAVSNRQCSYNSSNRRRRRHSTVRSSFQKPICSKAVKLGRWNRPHWSSVVKLLLLMLLFAGSLPAIIEMWSKVHKGGKWKQIEDGIRFRVRWMRTDIRRVPLLVQHSHGQMTGRIDHRLLAWREDALGKKCAHNYTSVLTVDQREA